MRKKYLLDLKSVRWKISEKEVDGKVFYYVSAGDWGNVRRPQRIWINRKCIIEDEKGRKNVKLVGNKIRVTERGNYVIVPDPDYFIAEVGWECGLRGSSWIEKIENIEVEISLKYYKSPRGSVGISTYCIVSTKKNNVIKAYLKRNGRLYGAESETIQIVKVENDEVVYDYISPEAIEDPELEEVIE